MGALVVLDLMNGWRDGAMIEDCVFCRISAGLAPASMVYQDEQVMAFMDVNQPISGKVLVSPRRHVEMLYELDDDLAARLFVVTVRIARAVRVAFHPDGLNLFQANGRAAQQSVFHLHIHVLPRMAGDAVTVRWPTRMPSRPMLDELAGAIRAAMGDGELTE